MWTHEAELIAVLLGTVWKIFLMEMPASVATIQSRLDLQIAFI